jgi:ankyrin repeat protein
MDRVDLDLRVLHANNLLAVDLELLGVAGINVNVVDENDDTALVWACRNGHGDVAIALLHDRRVQMYHRDIDDNDALCYARQRDLTAVVSIIDALDRGNKRMPLVLVYHLYVSSGSSSSSSYCPLSLFIRRDIRRHYAIVFI